MLLAALKTIVALTVILCGWLLVQGAWRRIFPGTPADEDVMAGRLGCHQCPRESTCEWWLCENQETALPNSNQSET